MANALAPIINAISDGTLHFLFMTTPHVRRPLREQLAIPGLLPGITLLTHFKSSLHLA